MRPASGALLLLLLAAYALVKAGSGEIADLLWASHVTSALLAVGLLFGLPALSAIGFVFHLGVAAPAYLLHLLAQGDTNWPSMLLHLLTPVFGWLAWHGQRLPVATMWRAWGIYLSLLLICRYATPEALNVNLAFKPWQASPFIGIWPNRIINAALVLTQLAAAQWLFNRYVAWKARRVSIAAGN